ncbi:hypothetical protein [Microbacterium sp.]|uniref:hypothetical protein n=1 Tax=Microbacterium sp. TaxID=51671 RepID=UPI003A84B8A3
MTDISTEYANTSAELTTAITSGDTSSLESQLNAITEKIDEVSSQITHPEVSELFTAFAGEWESLTVQYGELVEATASADTAKLAELSESIGVSGMALAEAGEAINTACD